MKVHPNPAHDFLHKMAARRNVDREVTLNEDGSKDVLINRTGPCGKECDSSIHIEKIDENTIARTAQHTTPGGDVINVSSTITRDRENGTFRREGSITTPNGDQIDFSIEKQKTENGLSRTVEINRGDKTRITTVSRSV